MHTRGQKGTKKNKKTGLDPVGKLEPQQIRVPGDLVGQVLPSGFFHFGILIAKPADNIRVAGGGFPGDDLKHYGTNMMRLYKGGTMQGSFGVQVLLTRSPKTRQIPTVMAKNRRLAVFWVGQKRNRLHAGLIEIIRLRKKAREIFPVTDAFRQPGRKYFHNS